MFNVNVHTGVDTSNTVDVTLNFVQGNVWKRKEETDIHVGAIY